MGRPRRCCCETQVSAMIRIAFLYADDILDRAARRRRSPARLTSIGTIAAGPYFSPDGSQIAYSTHADGDSDVYVVGSDGGVARRLTWEPTGSIATGWTPDGKDVLFTSVHASKSRLSPIVRSARRRRRARRGVAAAQRRLGQLFRGWQHAGLCSGAPVAAGMEALSGRPDFAGMAGEHEDSGSGEDPAGELQ